MPINHPNMTVAFHRQATTKQTDERMNNARRQVLRKNAFGNKTNERAQAQLREPTTETKPTIKIENMKNKAIKHQIKYIYICNRRNK